jgi:hypothetical protein
MTNRRSKSPAKLTSVKINLSFPGIGSVEGVWEADENEQKCVWEKRVTFHVALQYVQIPLRGYTDTLVEIEAVSAIHQA